jgi:hypothetical protein
MTRDLSYKTFYSYNQFIFKLASGGFIANHLHQGILIEGEGSLQLTA